MYGSTLHTKCARIYLRCLPIPCYDTESSHFNSPSNEAVRKWYSPLSKDDHQGVYSMPRLVRIAAYTHCRSRPDRRWSRTPAVWHRMCGRNPTNTAGKKMGLPRLIGKALNTRTIYLYRPDSMAGLVLRIPSRRRKGVRDYRFSRERQFQEFLDSLRVRVRGRQYLLSMFSA
jgi:hypothetical protein